MEADALALARRGWRIVPLHYPVAGGCSCNNQQCRATGKHPTVGRRWPEQASTNPTVIREWWARWPQANLGLATGRGSGLVVLDVDPRNGGDDELHELELSYEPLPQTVEVLTGGGGRGLLFRAPLEAVRNSANAVGPGLDVRGEGGLAVMPPSAHASGNPYVWSVDGHPEHVAPADPPAWLRALLTSRPAKPALEKARLVEGDRNVTLTRMAGSMRRAGFTAAAIGAALQRQNADGCKPPLEASEVNRITRSAASWASGPPWVTDPRGFLEDDRLDLTARMVLMVLALHAGPSGEAWPSYDAITAVGGVPRRKIRRSLDLLEQTGRIEQMRRSRYGNRYRLTNPYKNGSSSNSGVTAKDGGA